MIMLSKNKYREKSITDPLDYIKKYKVKKYNNAKLPRSCIIVYPYCRKIIENILKKLGVKFVKNSNIFLIEDRLSIFISFPSSPNVVCAIEELRVCGVKNFFNIGIAGSISDILNIGDVVLCKKAIRDEGTSYHYLKPRKFVNASKNLFSFLEEEFESNKIKFKAGYCWTTDAPYRETYSQIKKYRKKGVLCVDMETSAVFSVSEFYNLKSISVFVISDKLSRNQWEHKFDSRIIDNSLEKVLSLLIKSFR